MTHIHRSVLLMHTPRQLFALVDDVERYTEFVPGVIAALVHERTAGSLLATLKLKRAGISIEFTTRNTRTPDSAMRMELVQGPFKVFRAEWRFAALGDAGAKVEFDADVEVSGVLRGPVALIVESASNKLMEAFRKRAAALYAP